jgi:glycerol kinase
MTKSQLRYILALDQGSTSSRAVLYDHAGRIIYKNQTPLQSFLPAPDQVEHRPVDILTTQKKTISDVLRWLGKTGMQKIAAMGVTNQRSTFVLWDRKTGRPLWNAISWQDRRGIEICSEMIKHQDRIRTKTGLRLTPHSTIGKLRWVLDHVKGAKKKAESGELLFGTVNSYLIWNLTAGRIHATDHVNASRTLMLNLKTLEWDKELLSLFDIPEAILPNLLPTTASYSAAVLGKHRIPILSSIGDQQGSLCGQGGFYAGDMAVTYGTGGFLVFNTGDRLPEQSRLLKTIAWSSPEKTHYALEGTVNAAGSAILWLQHSLKLIVSPNEIDSLCKKAAGNVIMIPSISGLGSPHYSQTDSAFFGLNRKTVKADLVKGLIEGIAYLMKDNYEQIKREISVPIRRIVAGGGAARNSYLLQFQADLFQREVALASVYETSSRGAAYLAGLGCGFWKNMDAIQELKQTRKSFNPRLGSREVDRLNAGWKEALRLAQVWSEKSAP